MAPETKTPPVRDAAARVLLHTAERLAAETTRTGGPLTSGAVRLRALRTLGKGLGLVLLGGLLLWVMVVVLGMKGGGGLPAVVLIPTLFIGAAWLTAGLTGLLTGRPWDKTPSWVKLPMMLLGSVMALLACFVILWFAQQLRK
ncbi:hypothetical protein COSO111634_19585 [Corallococcus soli]